MASSSATSISGPSRLLDSSSHTSTSLQSPASPEGLLRTPGRSRASHACDRCRLMRTKCTGGSPCDKCRKDRAGCVFGDRKRERNKKELGESLLQIEDLRGKVNILLHTLKTVAGNPHLDPTESSNIRDVIVNCDLEIQDASSTSPSTRADDGHRVPTSSEQTPGAEQYADASVGSPGGQDALAHSIDMSCGRGPIGFIGKISEVSWIARAHCYLVAPAGQDLELQAKQSERTPATQFSYYMDDDNLLSLDEDYVDPLHWPGDMTARLLFEAFFHSLHGIFDCFTRERVLAELDGFPGNRPSLTWDQRKWLAMTNLMWAIGAKWLQRAMLNDDPGMEHHLLYYARARALGLDHRVLLENPGLQGINALGMLSLYLFINGSISRAWALVGLAIRNATCLGLHLKNVDNALSQHQLDERARLWYSLYCLEVTFAEVLGKPPLTSFEYTSVPFDALKDGPFDDTSGLRDIDTRRLWVDFLRRRRNAGQTMRGGQIPWQSFQFIGYGPPQQHLSFRARLSTISNQIMTQLYMPTLSGSWASVQKKITSLNTQLLEWEQSLPGELDLHSTVATDTDPRAKIDLALYLQSIKMILYRPCLCHIRIPGESVASKEFNLRGARSCVQAGVFLVEILPDDPSAHEAHQLLPWWNFVHYLSQTLAVFLLELCLNLEHFEGSVAQLTPHIQKAMSYLWCLTSESLTAYKAWRIFRQMFFVLSERLESFDVDIPMEAYVPEGWTESDEVALVATLGPISEPGMPLA